MYDYLSGLGIEARRLALAGTLLSVVTQVLMIGSLFDGFRGGLI
jgi:hypothetical protein